MTYDFRNMQGGSLNLNIVAWHKMFELAKLGGWEPAGTERPLYWDSPEFAPALEHEEWGAGYHTNDFQGVTAEDAAALADALERMLDDIPDVSPPNRMVDYAEVGVSDDAPPQLKALLAELGVLKGPNTLLNPLEFFGGEGKREVENFIDFCRQGEFVIY